MIMELKKIYIFKLIIFELNYQWQIKAKLIISIVAAVNKRGDYIFKRHIKALVQELSEDLINNKLIIRHVIEKLQKEVFIKYNMRNLAYGTGKVRNFIEN